MAGLVPAIHVLLAQTLKTWMPGTQASEATPFFERLWPGMTELRRQSLTFLRECKTYCSNSALQASLKLAFLRRRQAVMPDTLGISAAQSR